MDVAKALILVLLFNCSDVQTPDERGIQVTDRIGVFNQSKAMFTAQFMVEDFFGADFGGLSTHGAVVYWTDTKCPKNDQYAVLYEGKCNYGRMWSCQEMYVALSSLDSERTCGSALLHEFGHCLSMQLGQGGDSEHTNKDLWEVISEAKTIACDRGW